MRTQDDDDAMTACLSKTLLPNSELKRADGDRLEQRTLSPPRRLDVLIYGSCLTSLFDGLVLKWYSPPQTTQKQISPSWWSTPRLIQTAEPANCSIRCLSLWDYHNQFRHKLPLKAFLSLCHSHPAHFAICSIFWVNKPMGKLEHTQRSFQP